MSKYIKKATELVGWKWDENTLTGRKFFELPQSKREEELGCSQTWVEINNQVGLDALAAQLVRQVDEVVNDWRCLELFEGHTAVREFAGLSNNGIDLGACYGKGRAMNTIQAIVDSKVLEND